MAEQSHRKRKAVGSSPTSGSNGISVREFDSSHGLQLIKIRPTGRILILFNICYNKFMQNLRALLEEMESKIPAIRDRL